MAALLNEVVGSISGISEKALDSIKTRATALADSVKGESKDVAKDIAGYGDRILRTIDRRVNREITAADANIAIRNWKQSSKSALKKLKVFSEWEAHEQFWGHVMSVFKVVEGLLSVVAA